MQDTEIRKGRGEMTKKERLLNRIDGMREEAVAFLLEMVRTPSVNPPGAYENIAGLVGTRFEELGLEVETIRIPEEKVKALGLKAPRINVLGWLRGKDNGPTLVFNPHLDTVPVGDGWTMDPFEGVVRDGKIYGRGAFDSKGHLAAYTYALVALKREGVLLKGDALVAAAADEETLGDLGTKFLLDEGYLKADYAIVEGPGYFVQNAAGGLVGMEITVHGKAAHANTPERGIDAVKKMHKVQTALYRFHNGLKEKVSQVKGITSPTFVIGTIKGGMKSNIIAGECSITIDRRTIPEEDIREVETGIIALVKGLEKDDPGLKLSTRTTTMVDSWRTPKDHILISTLVKNATEVMGEKVVMQGRPGASDARLFSDAGIPVCNYGSAPRIFEEARAHGPDENLPIDDLMKGIKVMALTVADLLS